MRLVPSVIASHSWPRIAAALLFVTSPVWAQDDPTKPKTAPASAPGLSKAAAASIEEFMKTLPANLTPEQVAEIRRRLEASDLVRRLRTTSVKGADRGGPGAFPAADRGFPPPAGGGFGTFEFCGGTYDQLFAASKCPGPMSTSLSAFFYNKPSGTFAVWIPGSTVAAVNAEFMTIFPNQDVPIPPGTIFTAKCK